MRNENDGFEKLGPKIKELRPSLTVEKKNECHNP